LTTETFIGGTNVETENHRAWLEAVVHTEHAGRRRIFTEEASANHFVLFGDAVGITGKRLQDQRIGM
jgi:hypothetical protein